MRFVAGRGAVAKHLVRGAAVAERHRENAGRGAVAKRLAALWRIAIRKMLAEAPLRSALREAAPWRSAIGKTLPAGRCAKDKDREDADDRERHQEAASGSHTAAKGRWQERSSEC